MKESWFEAQEFRMKRLKQEGKDLGQERRVATEKVLFDQADERIDKFFERRRSAGTNNQQKR